MRVSSWRYACRILQCDFGRDTTNIYVWSMILKMINQNVAVGQGALTDLTDDEARIRYSVIDNEAMMSLIEV